MGEVKAEMRKLETENKRLKKEVERFRNEGRKGGNAKVPTRNESRTNNRNSAARNPGSYRTINVEATAYTARCSGCSGVTASGYDVRSTIYTPEGLRVLAAPKSIPFHTKMRVTLADGTSFVGEVLDRGGAIGEGKLDILVSDRATAYSLGRQAATVEIINE